MNLVVEQGQVHNHHSLKWIKHTNNLPLIYLTLKVFHLLSEVICNFLSVTLTLTGFNSESMYFFTFSSKLLRESNISFLSSGSKEESNGFEIIVLSEHKRPCENLHLLFLYFQHVLQWSEFGTT